MAITQQWTMVVTRAVAAGQYADLAAAARRIETMKIDVTGGPAKPTLTATFTGPDRWNIARKIRSTASYILAMARIGVEHVTVTDIHTPKGTVTRPRGGARGVKPDVEAGEEPAPPPRPCRSCSRNGARPKTKGSWGTTYGGAGR